MGWANNRQRLQRAECIDLCRAMTQQKTQNLLPNGSVTSISCVPKTTLTIQEDLGSTLIFHVYMMWTVLEGMIIHSNSLVRTGEISPKFKLSPMRNERKMSSPCAKKGLRCQSVGATERINVIDNKGSLLMSPKKEEKDLGSGSVYFGQSGRKTGLKHKRLDLVLRKSPPKILKTQLFKEINVESHEVFDFS